MVARSKQETLASLEAKVHAYCDPLLNLSAPDGLAEFASQLRQEGDLSNLRAVASEVDTWLREIHTIDEQAAIAAHMLARGVQDVDLPPNIDRTVRKLVRRGRLTSETEAGFVREILCNPYLVAKFAGDASQLQIMMEPWVVKL